MTGTEAPITARPRRLPREIWWLISEKAAEGRKKCATLFLLARLCRDMALIALPLMYGKIKDPDASIDDDVGIHNTEASLRFWRSIHMSSLHNTEASLRFWRSIIMSSLGKTLYPYCLWIKTLDIRNLQLLLKGLRKAPDLRPKFYSPPLDYLEVLDKSKTTDSLERPGSKALLFEVTNEITKYIKSMADQGHGSASLVCLEDPDLGYSPSSVYFPVWASRLTGLTTLRVIDGSCVEDHIAPSLVQHCPAFKHFECEKLSAGAESKLVRFCEQLSPNTLESFIIFEGPVVEGKALFQALDKHARSLKELRLEFMTPRAFASLDRLQNCTDLKTLALEGYVATQSDASWASNHASAYGRIVAWLQNCSQLKDLALFFIPSGSQLLQDVLKSPNVRLTDLCYKTSEANAPWYTSLHHQQSLRYLQTEVEDLELQNLGPVSGRCAGLAKGVSQLPELRDLIANEYFSAKDIERISEGARKLETITLDGTLIHDAYLMSLAKLPRLKELDVTGHAEFTSAGLLRFIKRMEKDPNGQHDGFSLSIARQGIELNEDHGVHLKDQIKRALNGTFYIKYIDSDGEQYRHPSSM